MIDLQLHTTDSDGTWPWEKVLEACLAMGLKAFAITDHDTTVRRKEVVKWGRDHNAMAIPGVELSTKEQDQTVHLLGYFLEGPQEALDRKLSFLKQGRESRNALIVRKLQSLGCRIEEEEVFRLANGGTIGRPHIARLLMEKGVVRSLQEAFERYLTPGGLAYFPKEELPLREAIELLRGAGAVTSVAHPGLLKRLPQDLEVSMKEWRSWGLDAIEGIYPTYSKEQTVFFHRTASKYGLLVTGGSDFHGDNKPHIQIGTGTGTLNVPDDILPPLLERRDEINRQRNRPAQSEV